MGSMAPDPQPLPAPPPWLRLAWDLVSYIVASIHLIRAISDSMRAAKATNVSTDRVSTPTDSE